MTATLTATDLAAGHGARQLFAGLDLWSRTHDRHMLEVVCTNRHLEVERGRVTDRIG